MVLYVDDLLFASNCEKWRRWFKHQFESRFEMSKMNEGEVTLYLKEKLIQVPKGIFLTQKAYAWQALVQFEMENYVAVSTPMIER